MRRTARSSSLVLAAGGLLLAALALVPGHASSASTGVPHAPGLAAPRVQLSVKHAGPLLPDDDYPAPWRPPTPIDTILDSWGEWNRECTSFVAWRLHSRNGFEMPFYDNAGHWGADAQARGFTVDMNPAVGSVAWIRGHRADGTDGHVAWVEAVSGNTVTVEQYNANFNGYYSYATVAKSNYDGFIHFADISGAGPPRIIIRSGSTLYAKSGVNGSWVTEAGGLTSSTPILAGGGMIGYDEHKSKLESLVDLVYGLNRGRYT